MSIEIPGTDPKIRELSGEVGQSGARAVRTTGVPAGEAFTVGVNAADYAAQILLTALREAGYLDISLIDTTKVKTEIEGIEAKARITEHMHWLRLNEDRYYNARPKTI